MPFQITFHDCYCKSRIIAGFKLITNFYYMCNRTAEIMFEKYQVPALFLAKNAVSFCVPLATPSYQTIDVAKNWSPMTYFEDIIIC